MMQKNLRPLLLKLYTEKVRDMREVYRRQDGPLLMRGFAKQMGISLQEAKEQMELELVEFSSMEVGLATAKTIIFSTEQAEVFRQVSKEYTEGLNYTLPFPSTLLQFTSPLPVITEKGEKDGIIALYLSQTIITQETIERNKELAEEGKKWGSTLKIVIPDKPDEVLNTIIMVYSDYNIRKLGWLGGTQNILFEKAGNKNLGKLWQELKNLAIACIGYINCENVILKKEEAPPKLVRKKERQGKEAPESYYVCKLKGVTSDTHATGNGTEHGYRYDVRGHFRRLKTGMTIWVKPHQRGLEHELYIPKTYYVPKGAKKIDK